MAGVSKHDAARCCVWIGSEGPDPIRVVHGKGLAVGIPNSHLQMPQVPCAGSSNVTIPRVQIQGKVVVAPR